MMHFAALVFLSMAISEVWSAGCSDKGLGGGCLSSLVERANEKDWPKIFGEVFDNVSSERVEGINILLMKHMKYIREYVRPKCQVKFYKDQGFRDLRNLDCIVDETFIRLLSLSSKLRCFTLDCKNSATADWKSAEILLHKRTMLMWLDMVPVKHGKVMRTEDRNNIIDFIVDKFYLYIKSNDLRSMRNLLRDMRLPSLQQMDQIIHKTCSLHDSRWENDLACAWRSVQDKLFLLTSQFDSKDNKVKQLWTSVDYKKKLELEYVGNVIETATMTTRENLEQFSEEILSLKNNNFEKLGDYFASLAKYDNEIAKADINYITTTLNKFSEEQMKLTKKLADITEALAKDTLIAGVLDTIFAWAKAALAAALAVSSMLPPDVDSGGIIEALDKVDELAASTANLVKVTSLTDVVKEVSKDMRKVYNGLKDNSRHLEYTKKILMYESNPDSAADIEEIQKRFLDAYNAYDPKVSSADIARLEQGFHNVRDVIKDSLDDMTQAAASGVKAKIFATNNLEKMASLISQITRLLESQFEYQFDLMDTLAVYLRAKLAKNMIGRLTDSIEEVRSDQSAKFARKQTAVDALITSRMHTLQALQLHCNALEYSNAGDMPSVCTNAMQNLTDSAIIDVIAYNPESCDGNTSSI